MLEHGRMRQDMCRWDIQTIVVGLWKLDGRFFSTNLKLGGKVGDRCLSHVENVIISV